MKQRVQLQLSEMKSISVNGREIEVWPSNYQLLLYKIDDEIEDVAAHLPYELTSIDMFHDADSLGHIVLNYLTENVANIAIKVQGAVQNTDTHKLSIQEHSQ